MHKQEIISFLQAEFPHHKKISIDEVGEKSARIRHHIGKEELRPGGTVSGPVSMLLADVAMYVAILGELGLVPLAVTTNLSINFLRKPSATADLIGDCKLLKVGKALVVGEVTIFSEGQSEPVAHVVSTYSIPPSDRN